METAKSITISERTTFHPATSTTTTADVQLKVLDDLRRLDEYYYNKLTLDEILLQDCLLQAISDEKCLKRANEEATATGPIVASTVAHTSISQKVATLASEAERRLAQALLQAHDTSSGSSSSDEDDCDVAFL